MLDKLVYSNLNIINELIAGELTINGEYSLPTLDGSTNQVFATDGAGNITFVDASTLVPEQISIVDAPGISWNLAGTVYTPTISLAPFSTTDLAEGASLYFTDARVATKVASLIQNGTGISWNYVDGVSLTPTISLAAFNTSNLAEGSNQYFTNTRVSQRVSNILLPGQKGSNPTNPIIWQYNSGPGTLVPTVSLAPFSTTDLSEGDNLYHTTARAKDAAAAILTGGTHVGVGFTYDSLLKTLDATVDQTPTTVQLANVSVGTQPIVNFCAGNLMGLTVSEDTLNTRVNVLVDYCGSDPIMEIGGGILSTHRIGSNNFSDGNYSTVGGGYGNRSVGAYSTVSGGYCNCSKCDYSSIVGGFSNIACHNGAVIAGRNITSVSAYTFHTNNIAIADQPTLTNTDSDFIVRQANGLLASRKFGGLFAQTEESAPVTATVSEVTILATGSGSLDIVGTDLLVGDTLEFILAGKIQSANAETLRIRIKLYSVLLIDTGLMTLPALTDNNWRASASFTVREIGIATVAKMMSEFAMYYVDDTGTTRFGSVTNAENSTTFSTDSEGSFEVTAEWGSTNAANSIQTTSFLLKKTF